MIETAKNNLMRDFEMRMQYQGMNLDMYAQFTGTTVEELREKFGEQAVANVKTSLIIEAVAKAEDIKPSEDEISVEYEKLAELYKMDAEELRKRIPVEDLSANLTSTKTVEFLVENAKVKEGK